jgi:hypothetical protein
LQHDELQRIHRQRIDMHRGGAPGKVLSGKSIGTGPRADIRRRLLSEYMNEARYQAAKEVSVAVCNAIADVIAIHGDDPKHATIVAAGVVRALRQMGKTVDAGIPQIARDLLNEPD